MPLKVLFLTPYPYSTAPSQRFRFEQYYEIFKNHQVTYHTQSFIDDLTWSILYLPGYTLQKTLGIVKGFLRRVKILFNLNSYDFIFIHREAAPIGPPIFEWLISKVLAKKIIYDFDDAIWLPNTSEQNRIATHLKWHNKVGSICKWSYKISAGNAYLADYARQFNDNVIINPTTLDTVNVHNRIKNKFSDATVKAQAATVIIGWTGSHSTLQYLEAIIPILQSIESQFDIEFRVISNKDPKLPLKKYTFIKWKKETEIEDLFSFDIGIMPLTDDKWANGKCGFKALQYMALGIASLVSPVGVNTEIVQNDINGFICSSPEEWSTSIKHLIDNPELRYSIGCQARTTIEKKFSVISNTENFLKLFS